MKAAGRIVRDVVRPYLSMRDLHQQTPALCEFLELKRRNAIVGAVRHRVGVKFTRSGGVVHQLLG